MFPFRSSTAGMSAEAGLMMPHEYSGSIATSDVVGYTAQALFCWQGHGLSGSVLTTERVLLALWAIRIGL